MLYVHGESYSVAHVPYSVSGADPMDTSDEDLALLLRANLVLVFVIVILWVPGGGGGGGGASVEPFL